MSTLTNVELAQFIDHTLLKADAQAPSIHRLCEEAIQFQFYSVCVNSYWVKACQSWLEHSPVKVACVVGFPLGAQLSEVKAYEAEKAVSEGATEIDMVLPIGLLMQGDDREVFHDIEKVVKALRDQALVKVILETGYLTDLQKIKGCQLAEQAGAHYVKTSTGFGPGSATEADIQLMRKTVSPHIGVKASGGVRDKATALRMIASGATRIGTSAGVAILQDLQSQSTY
jgi:deoxyribose-phosphate aldolase